MGRWGHHSTRRGHKDLQNGKTASSFQFLSIICKTAVEWDQSLKTSFQSLMQELEAKEEQIRLLKRECDERLRLLNQAELRLQEMTGQKGVA